MKKPIKKQEKTGKATHEQQMRSRIKQAAFELMAEKGIDAVSMREIAEKVQVTKPVLYYYFKDKEDLCHAIMEEQAAHFDEFLEISLAKKLHVTDFLTQVFERHIDFFQEDPLNSQFVVGAMVHVLANKGKGVQPDEKHPQRMGEMFKQASARGEIPAKGLEDFQNLVRALFLQIMLSSWVDVNMRGAKQQRYDKTAAKRFANILVLGVREYYKEKNK